MMAVLLQSVAVQVARIYDDAEQVFPERVIDDLVSALGLPAAVAIPAQTVVSFSEIDVRETVPVDLPLIGYARTGEEIHFLPDVGIDLIPATLRFAAVLEDDRLHTLAGASIDEDGTPIEPRSVNIRKQRAPLMLLAIASGDNDISRLGIHVDAAPLGGHASVALARSPWYLLSEASLVTEELTMLPRVGRGGVRQLHWVHPSDAVVAPDPAIEPIGINTPVAEGPYGHQLFVLPDIPRDRRVKCLPPAIVRDVLPQLLAEEHRGAFEHPLIWLAVQLPAGLTAAASSLQSVSINAVSVSNMEIMSEHVTFQRQGTATAVRAEGQSGRHLIGVQSVLGERNDRYVPESDVVAAASVGRYRVERNRVYLEPSRSATGRLDRHADLRLLFTDGERGNGVDVGRVTRIGARLMNPTVQINNNCPSRGGTNPPEYPLGRLQLAEALRSRERAVTLDDFEILAQAFEPRVKRVRVNYIGTVAERRLRPAHMVTVTVVARDFGDPETELRRLRDQLERHLQDRALIGHTVRVHIEEVS